MAPNDRKVRIETGSGLEAAFPDAVASAIIQAAILLIFREGKLSAGTEAGVGALIAKLGKIPERGHPNAIPSSDACAVNR